MYVAIGSRDPFGRTLPCKASGCYAVKTQGCAEWSLEPEGSDWQSNQPPSSPPNPPYPPIPSHSLPPLPPACPPQPPRPGPGPGASGAAAPAHVPGLRRAAARDGAQAGGAAEAAEVAEPRKSRSRICFSSGRVALGPCFSIAGLKGEPEGERRSAIFFTSMFVFLFGAGVQSKRRSEGTGCVSFCL